MKKIKFNKVECDVVFGKYENGRTAIHLTESGCPYATASINKPDMENAGMVKALQEAGIVQPLYPWPIGTFGASAWVCKILED